MPDLDRATTILKVRKSAVFRASRSGSFHEVIMSDKTSTGFRCPGCNVIQISSAYVYAHWHHELTFTCPECSTRCDIREGVVKGPDGEEVEVSEFQAKDGG